MEASLSLIVTRNSSTSLKAFRLERKPYDLHMENKKLFNVFETMAIF